MTKEDFKKLAEKHLFILEGYTLDQEGNKEMQIYGFDALFEQLLIQRVVGQSEQLKALEDLKQWCFETCQPLEEERLHEILKRL